MKNEENNFIQKPLAPSLLQFKLNNITQQIIVIKKCTVSMITLSIGTSDCLNEEVAK